MRHELVAILQHALGLNESGQGTQYRNHFVVSSGCADYELCRELVVLRYMNEREGSDLSGGLPIFYVTKEGKAAVAQYSPAPPKRTRSQQRYQRYLDHDSSLSFRDWLRTESAHG